MRILDKHGAEVILAIVALSIFVVGMVVGITVADNVHGAKCRNHAISGGAW